MLRSATRPMLCARSIQMLKRDNEGDRTSPRLMRGSSVLNQPKMPEA